MSLSSSSSPIQWQMLLNSSSSRKPNCSRGVDGELPVVNPESVGRIQRCHHCSAPGGAVQFIDSARLFRDRVGFKRRNQHMDCYICLIVSCWCWNVEGIVVNSSEEQILNHDHIAIATGSSAMLGWKFNTMKCLHSHVVLAILPMSSWRVNRCSTTGECSC